MAQLDDSLRSLVDELQQRERQLLALNQGLEDRIAERTQALSQANADLRSFSRSVAHDVKGPIGAIAMVLRNLARERSEPLTVAAPRVLPMVITECDRLGVLVDELLMLSMVDEREMQCQAVDMGELADAVLADLRQSGPGQRVVFQREPLPVVQGDPVLLRQVWQNLLGNAVRFSARQDSPACRCGRGATATNGSSRCRTTAWVSTWPRRTPVRRLPAAAPQRRLPRHRRGPVDRQARGAPSRRPRGRRVAARRRCLLSLQSAGPRRCSRCSEVGQRDRDRVAVAARHRGALARGQPAVHRVHLGRRQSQQVQQQGVRLDHAAGAAVAPHRAARGVAVEVVVQAVGPLAICRALIVPLPALRLSW